MFRLRNTPSSTQYEEFSWTFLWWELTATSYKIRITNSYFLLLIRSGNVVPQQMCLAVFLSLRQSWNWYIRSKTSRYSLDLWTGWIGCRCNAHKKQVGVKQLYNPVPQTESVSWRQSQLEFASQFEAVRTSS